MGDEALTETHASPRYDQDADIINAGILLLDRGFCVLNSLQIARFHQVRVSRGPVRDNPLLSALLEVVFFLLRYRKIGDAPRRVAG